MPLLSVITAGYAPQAGYLKETVLGLLEQELPPGWEFEWVFQEDGGTPSLGELVDDVPGARYAANHKQLGIAGTRNLALSRARGELIRVLDHDDVLLPGALAAPLRWLEDPGDPGVQWVLTASDEIGFGGERHAAEPVSWSGRVPRGSLGALTDSAGRWSVYCAGLTARIDVVRALGGWMAVPRSEDVGLLTVLAELTDGYIDPEVRWLYRRHPVQTHLTEDWQARAAQGAELVAQRLASLRAVRGLLCDGATG